jgi:hypothetical protein
MIMRTLTYFLILSALVWIPHAVVHAQRTHNFELAEVYPLGGNSQYDRLRVIDARTSKERLGYLKTGTFNRSADLVTARPFDKVLSDYYTKMLTGSPPTDSAELVMVLHDIMIQDRIGGREIAALFLDADFFCSRDKKYYYLGTADTLYETLAGFDVSEKLLKGSAHKIATILSTFSGIRVTDGNKSYTEGELQRMRATERDQYPAYKAAGKLKRGVYYTLGQFLSNTPVDTPILVKVVPGHIKDVYTSLYYPKSRQNKKPVLIETKDVFAVSDGEHLLCSHERGFTEMTYEDGEFYATQFFSGIECARGRTTDMFGFVSATTAPAGAAADAPGYIVALPYRAKLLPAQKRFIPLQIIR